jgi:hypothetical protein
VFPARVVGETWRCPGNNDDVNEHCSLCARVADPERDGDPPLGWCADNVEVHGGTRTRWVCADCTRRHVRAIEAKLDQNWW